MEYPRNSKLRDPASIQIRAGDSSTLKYLVPMVATVDGYSAELDLNLDDVLVSSSLNDMVIIDVESYKVCFHTYMKLLLPYEICSSFLRDCHRLYIGMKKELGILAWFSMIPLGI